jgi:hypothetical protein
MRSEGALPRIRHRKWKRLPNTVNMPNKISSVMKCFDSAMPGMKHSYFEGLLFLSQKFY